MEMKGIGHTEIFPVHSSKVETASVNILGEHCVLSPREILDTEGSAHESTLGRSMLYMGSLKSLLIKSIAR
jgi:hypothetical protein